LKGKVVIINVWATWCGPCRREIPALAALQSKYEGKLQIVGLLDDNVSADVARTFGTSVGINFPIVASTFEIESRLPKILALPTTFVLDDQGRLVAMYAEEIDPAQLEREILRLIRTAPAPGG
jgi:thiol-disulfide isomerase/thioredoxin